MSQIINVGNQPNDGLGDKLRDAFIIVNENFESIDTLLSGTDVLTISQITGLQTALNNIQNQLDYIPGLQTDINSINNTIFTINSTLNSQNSSIADLYTEITNLQTQIYTKVEEAPIDGLEYARKDAGWVVVSGGTVSIPTIDEVLGAGSIAIDKNITLNSSGSALVLLADSISAYSGNSFFILQPTQISISNSATNYAVDLFPDSIRFRDGSIKQFLKSDPLQNSTFEPTFYLPAKNATTNYRLATTLDYTLNNVLTAGSTTSQTAGFLSGTRATNINHTGLEVLDTGGNQMTTKIESDVIRFTRFGNNVTLSALNAAGSNSANYIFPTKSPGTYSLATTVDLYSVTSLNANTLNISTLGSGVSVSRSFNVRGLTSSNNTISIVGTGSNTLTNWAWDLRSLNGLPIGGTGGQILIKNSSTNYDTSWANTSSLGFVPYTGANNNVNLGTYSLTSAKGLYQFTDNNNQFYVERNDYGYNRLYFNTIDTSGDEFGTVNVTINPEESISLSKVKTSSSEIGSFFLSENLIQLTVQNPNWNQSLNIQDGGLSFYIEENSTSQINEIYFNADRTIFNREVQLPKVYFNSTGETSVEQALTWNDDYGTMDIGLKGGNVTLQVGQEEVIRVVNKTGANLLESQYRCVRVRTQAEGGSQGQRLAVVMAQANTKANHTGVLGLVTENINNNEEGFITTFGYIRNINTTGSLQSETWLDGDTLWLSETVAGGLTNVEPTTHPVQIGYVVYSHSNNGKIFIRISEGVDELDELHNVAITGATAGQVLTYTGTLWENQTPSGGLTLNEVQRIAFLKI